ncbi:MAG: hypothetical protein U9R38_01425 [Candidatus Margulisiibacteriota bacterium]|nr:hypothetical protein [Candidatus Margulisiibacteriota bacterium]
MAITAATRNIRFAVRGFGGEIGDTMTRVLMAMNRGKFRAFKQVTGESITALIRHKEGMSLNATVRADRSFAKLERRGALATNTASSYAYIPTIEAVVFDKEVGGRVHIHGTDGRVLTVDYKPVPSSNVDRPELDNLDFLIDATGVGLKKDAGLQHPGHYANYDNLTVLFSAPIKTVKGVPHHLNGLNLVSAEQLNATGSCSTHAGVDVIRYIREGIMEKLGLGEGEIIIEGGHFNATHSLTPSDAKVLPYYDSAYIPQTTGFGSAAGVVYPVSHIGNIAAATGRYNSFFKQGDVEANGTSIFSLAMTISVKHRKEPVTHETIQRALLNAASDPEGSKHIGVLKDVVKLKTNKRAGYFTSLSISGMPQTAILSVGPDNISVVKIGGKKVDEQGNEFDMYVVTINNVGYDNRLGFTVDMLDEANGITAKRLGTELIPRFHHVDDLGNNLAFISSTVGRQLFANAVAKTGGQLLV